MSPEPIQCSGTYGMLQGEAYVKHLMKTYVGQYGSVAMFALIELGVKVKVRAHVWSA